MENFDPINNPLVRMHRPHRAYTSAEAQEMANFIQEWLNGNPKVDNLPLAIVNLAKTFDDALKLRDANVNAITGSVN